MYLLEDKSMSDAEVKKSKGSIPRAIRLSDSEFKKLVEAAGKSGLGWTTFVRECALKVADNAALACALFPSPRTGNNAVSGLPFLSSITREGGEMAKPKRAETPDVDGEASDADEVRRGARP
jgi:hypothetical protein